MNRILFHLAVVLIALAWNGPAFCDEIHEAAKAGDLEKVRTLLRANPDLVFSKDDDGETPLTLAAYEGHKDMVEFLLVHKAEVNAEDIKGQTPLHQAAKYGHKDVVKLLRQHGGHE